MIDIVSEYWSQSGSAGNTVMGQTVADALQGETLKVCWRSRQFRIQALNLPKVVGPGLRKTASAGWIDQQTRGDLCQTPEPTMQKRW